MKVIGLTGSIAAGKSTVAGWIRDLGIAIHDADAAVHELLSPHGAAVGAILAEFEPDLAGHDLGNLEKGINRQALAIMFLLGRRHENSLNRFCIRSCASTAMRFWTSSVALPHRRLFWMCLCCLKLAVMLFVIISSLFMPARQQRPNAPWLAPV